MEQSNHLIVGWGLAGATLAWQLHFKSIPFTVFDSLENHSTRTAAGIVNPIVFKRLTKSWNADILMPVAVKFYQKVEQLLDVKIIHPKHIFKIFTSFEDENNWAVKQNDPLFKSYLCPLRSYQINLVDAPFGFGEVNTFGNLDTNTFLDASKAFFKNLNYSFINQYYNYNDYNNPAYSHTYFCEGAGISHNPFFNYLPLKPTHGETLLIETREFKFDHILNKNMFIMHIRDNLYKVGATYNWELNEPVTTENGKSELIKKLKLIAEFDFKVIDHQAGIRPTVKDRRPLIGQHPEHKNLYVFNGLGTKGVMIAPYYAIQLLDFATGGQDLDNDVNIDRYKKYLH